jgi:hypothetical protein
MAKVKLEGAVDGYLMLNRVAAFLVQLPTHPEQVLLAISWVA